MPRLLAALSVPAVLLAVAPAAPVPKDARPPFYFPTRVGTEWVDGHGPPVPGGRPLEMRSVVTAVEAHRDGLLVSVGDQVNGEVREGWQVLVSDRGLFQTVAREQKLDPPVCLLAVPHRPGDRWKSAFPPDQTGERVVRGTERVDVPAGTYQAVRVVCKYTFEGKPGTATYWYAPGVGEVKMVDDQGTDRVLRVLKSFTPGKD